MTTPGHAADGDDSLDEDRVAGYLRAHPDFLARRDDVLEAIDVPHRPGPGVASLLERQVAALRERNERLEARLAELLETARENERVGARLLGLARALLEADSLDGVLALVRESMVSELGVDEVAIQLIDPGDARRAARAPGRFAAPDDPALAPFSELLASGRPQCGGLSAEQLAALFGDAAERVGSAAVVPLRSGRALGLLGLGDADPGHFRRDLGTLFLGQLGELVSAAVARRIDGG